MSEEERKRELAIGDIEAAITEYGRGAPDHVVLQVLKLVPDDLAEARRFWLASCDAWELTRGQRLDHKNIDGESA
jgi:hypothetical protein